MTISSAARGAIVEEVILPPVRDLGDGFEVHRALPSVQRQMVGPFIFLDHFEPTVFRAGEGQNVRPHPHIGLSTLTYLLEGEIVHRDSVGNVEVIRSGDVNWMTAGSGIVHSARSPAHMQAQGGTLFGQQIWVALPKALEEMQPGFSHHAEGTRTSTLRGVLGCRLMRPARSSVSTIWWTEGGLTRKYSCMSVSAGGLRCSRV